MANSFPRELVPLTLLSISVRGHCLHCFNTAAKDFPGFFTRFEVFERFAELTQGKMALLISHRFSTVRMADRIVVLSGGRLIEEGTHSELMERSGLYAEMFELQAASYR